MVWSFSHPRHLIICMFLTLNLIYVCSNVCFKSIYMSGLIFLQYFILFLQAGKFLHDEKRR